MSLTSAPVPGGERTNALREVAALELEPTRPFAFDPTFHKPDHFSSPDTAWEPGVRWQTFHFRGRLFGLRIEDAGSRVRLRVWARRRPSDELLSALADELSWRANLRLDLRDFERGMRRDSQLAAVVRRMRGMRPMHLGSLYEYLVIAIVLQNATVRRSAQMLRALFERYGTLLNFDRRDLYGFWDASALAGTAEQELRSLKLGYRARSLLRVSDSIARGDVDEQALRGATVDEQRAALLSLYGVGPASVGYILVDVFHAFDEAAHISPWEQRIYSRLLLGAAVDEPAPVDVLLDRIARWSPWRALAVHYVWEDLFWRHKTEGVDWLAPLIRL
jgi:3-methyladenine DNA glycosylase/8-oxoguanine DNA glycosylase